MTRLFDEIVNNAQKGIGPCEGCPCHLDTQGKLVNPGLINPDADLMFLTIDPSHGTDWGKYADWAEYNKAKTTMFIERADGGSELAKLLDGIPGISIDDIWLADAIKCPANNDRAGIVDSETAFDHCSSYLRKEIEEIDPKAIVAMGNDPAEQILDKIFNRGIGEVNAGSNHAGDIHWVTPPVVVSPHWSYGWLNRNNNRAKVRSSILRVLKA